MTKTALVRRDEPRAIAPVTEPDTLAPMSFSDMMAMGDQLVSTGFLPQHFRNGAQVAAVIMTGRELGMQPMRAIRSLQLVKGKVWESADSQLSRFKAAGGRAHFVELTDERAVLVLRHPNGDEHTETFGLEDAKKAGLLANDNYRKHPKAMYRSRAITAGLKSLGWEGAVGAYDESEDITDDADERRARWQPPVSAPVATLAPVPAPMDDATQRFEHLISFPAWTDAQRKSLRTRWGRSSDAEREEVLAGMRRHLGLDEVAVETPTPPAEFQDDRALVED